MKSCQVSDRDNEIIKYISKRINLPKNLVIKMLIRCYVDQPDSGLVIVDDKVLTIDEYSKQNTDKK